MALTTSLASPFKIAHAVSASNPETIHCIYVDTSIDKDRALYISFYNLGILAETLPNLHGMYLEEVISSMELPRFTCFNPNLDSMTTSGYLSKLPFGRKSIM